MREVSNLSAVQKDIDAKMLSRLVGIATQYERIVDGMMTEPKTGRLYASAAKLKAFGRYQAGKRKTAPSGVHRASAPGEAPAIDTAALRKGIAHVITRVDGMAYSIQVGITLASGRAAIAKWLEFGTSRIAARPMWRPALEILRRSMTVIRGE